MVILLWFIGIILWYAETAYAISFSYKRFGPIGAILSLVINISVLLALISYGLYYLIGLR